MKRLAPILLLLVGCHETVKKSMQLDEVVKLDTQEQEQQKMDTAETKAQAASSVDTKTTNEDSAVEVEGPSGELTIAMVTPKTPLRLPRGSRVIGTIPLTHREVDSKKDIGAKTDSKVTEVNSAKTNNTQGAMTIKAGAQEETVIDAGPGWKFYAWILLVIVLVLAAGWAYLKFFLKPPWLPRWL